MDEPDAGRWPSVCATLPQLSSLVFKCAPGSSTAFEHGDYGSSQDHVDELYDAIQELGECKRLAHLGLSAHGYEGVWPSDLLEHVGEAAGTRLVSLALAGGEIRDDRECWYQAMFGSGVACKYPRLEVLRLAVRLCYHPVQEDALLEVLRTLAGEAEEWSPTLRELSACIELDWRLPADVMRRVHARCEQLSAACDGVGLYFDILQPEHDPFDPDYPERLEMR